jgi:dihydroorotate dehydrogenase (NAD+) catalytic subunit
MPKLKLDPPIVNACGILSYLDVFRRLELMGANFGAWVPKSIGPYSRDPVVRERYGWGAERLGNPNPTVAFDGPVQLNAFALPTHPVESWIEEFERTSLEKPVIGSVYGNKPEDYAVLISMVDKYVQAWELNVSCPNTQQGEQSVMAAMASKIESVVKPLRGVTTKPIIVKLSPNEDYVYMARIAAPYVDYIACGNTLGPGLVIDIYSGRPELAGNFGGMSGPAIRAKMMKMVYDVRQALRGTDVGIVAYGGIETWEHVIAAAMAGASIFGLGTCLAKVENDRVMGRTSKEIVKLSHGIWDGVQGFLKERDSSLDDLVGSLRI